MTRTINALGACTAAGLLCLATAGAAQHGAPAVSHHTGAAPAAISFGESSNSVPFELHRGSRMFLNANINGQPAPIMLDTGASITAIDSELARSLGIKILGKASINGAGGHAVDAEVATGVTMRIGSTKLNLATVIVMDLQPVSRAIGKPLPVVLGTDLFNNCVVRIDWAGGKLTIMDPKNFKPSSGDTEVKLGKAGPFRSIPLSVVGLPPIDAVLDLGNGGTIVLPSDYWQKHPELSSLKSAQSFSGGVGGQTHTVRKVTLPSASLAGQSFTDIPATLAGDSNGGHPASSANVGIEMLKAFDVTLDIGRSRVFLKPLPKVPEWYRERVGALVELRGDRLSVRHVSVDGPAADAGLKSGDEITAIDGEPIDSNFYSGKLASWNRGPAGSTIRLTLANGVVVPLTLKDYY